MNLHQAVRYHLVLHPQSRKARVQVLRPNHLHAQAHLHLQNHLAVHHLRVQKVRVRADLHQAQAFQVLRVLNPQALQAQNLQVRLFIIFQNLNFMTQRIQPNKVIYCKLL